tara:strand:+ start:28769 stop:29425 length:657 start_codon:yes stop_codon:yes gene_type:complete
MWIWLSHTLNENTEGYRGNKSLDINNTSSIKDGHSSNSITFTMNNHLGTHVDAPYHFIDNGKKISDYTASDWVFKSPLIINIKLTPGELLYPDAIEKELDIVDDADILIIKTEFEQYRGSRMYWEKSPGYSADLCELLLEKFKSIKGFGFDSISLSSLLHREEGRRAHRKLLSHDIRIFEDLKLSNINPKDSLETVIASPLIIDGCDGGPCTIMAEIK